jgi:hypothetical protein
LLLNVVQSAELNRPLLLAEAVGRLSVITGVVVGLATVEETSVPDVPRVKAETLKTVPVPEGTTNCPGVDQVNDWFDFEFTRVIETQTLFAGVTGG